MGGTLLASIAANILLFIFARPIYNNIRILMTRLPIFIFGTILGCLYYNKNKYIVYSKANSKLYALVFFASSLLYSVLRIVRIKITTPVLTWFSYFPLSIAIVILLTFILCKFNISITSSEKWYIKVLNNISKMSFEMYLIHIIIIHIISKYDFWNKAGLYSNFMYIGLIVVPYLISLIVVKLSNLICKNDAKRA